MHNAVFDGGITKTLPLSNVTYCIVVQAEREEFFYLKFFYLGALLLLVHMMTIK